MGPDASGGLDMVIVRRRSSGRKLGEEKCDSEGPEKRCERVYEGNKWIRLTILNAYVKCRCRHDHPHLQMNFRIYTYIQKSPRVLI